MRRPMQVKSHFASVDFEYQCLSQTSPAGQRCAELLESAAPTGAAALQAAPSPSTSSEPVCVDMKCSSEGVVLLDGAPCDASAPPFDGCVSAPMHESGMWGSTVRACDARASGVCLVVSVHVCVPAKLAMCMKPMILVAGTTENCMFLQ